MGFALPGVIAATLVDRTKKNLAICGDGGVMMNIQDLMTAVQYKLPAVIMVWEDGGYGLIEWKQTSHFGKSSHVHFVNPDFVALAESFGAKGIRVESADGLIPALDAAFAETDVPTVIVVPVDYRENMKLTKRLGEMLMR